MTPVSVGTTGPWMSSSFSAIARMVQRAQVFDKLFPRQHHWLLMPLDRQGHLDIVQMRPPPFLQRPVILVEERQ